MIMAAQLQATDLTVVHKLFLNFSLFPRRSLERNFQIIRGFSLLTINARRA